MEQIFNFDRETIALYRSKMSQTFYQLILLVEYIPFVGPMYNATYALNILFELWTGKWLSPLVQNVNSSGSGSSTSENDNNGGNSSPNDDISIEKYQIAREKGLAAIASALIDLFTLCLMLGIMAYACACLEMIRTFWMVRYVIFGLVLFSMVAFTIGAKILSGQWAAYMTRQLHEVNTVSSSMVKSATITANAIEKIVEKTNYTTGVAVYRFNLVYSWIEDLFYLIFMTPVLLVRSVLRVLRVRANQTRYQLYLMRIGIKHKMGKLKINWPFQEKQIKEH